LGSSVGIATELWAGRSGDRNPVGVEIFRTCPDRPWGPPSLLYHGYRVFPGSKERPGGEANSSPPSNAVVKKEYSYTSIPTLGPTACTEPLCLYKGDLYLYWWRHINIYLFSLSLVLDHPCHSHQALPVTFCAVCVIFSPSDLTSSSLTTNCRFPVNFSPVNL
jgi:hypothetical protein